MFITCAANFAAQVVYVQVPSLRSGRQVRRERQRRDRCAENDRGGTGAQRTTGTGQVRKE